MQRLCRFLMPCAAAVLVGAAPAGAVPLYDVTILAGAGSVANDLNARGQVVGSMTVGGASHAFLSGADGPRDLGTLGGENSTALAINARGDVVGNAQLGDGIYRGFVYAGGALAALPSASYTTAADINDAGVVTGSTSVAFPFANPQHAFTYANGAYTDLGVLPGGDGSFAAAINNRGEVVGAASPVMDGAPNFPLDPFLYRDGTMTDLGTLGGIWTGATDINDRGQVVGYAGLESRGGNLYPSTAFIYENGVMRDLGGLVADPDRTFGSGATGINNLGQVVGRAGVAPGREHAFLVDDGTMFDLNALVDPASGWEITNAAAINDLGQIAATACKGGLCYAARLDHVPAVPEPSVLALLGGGLALLGWRRRQAWGFTPLAPRCPG